ncbi:MAG: hypothetical protein ABUL68_02935 [Pseudomonadota bacterium]
MMKRLVIGLIGLGVLGEIAFLATRPSAPPAVPAPPAVAPPRSTAVAPPATTPNERAPKEPDSAAAAPHSAATEVPAPSAPATEPKPEQPDPFRQTMDLLLSAQTGLQQKRALWAQLRQTGQLDRAIAELEQRATSDPASAEYPTALGEAYLFKIETVEDSRDQAILGMKADQRFDAALKLDPANWEAGFYKAAALARWPDNLNKGPEVVQRFTDLIQLQEALPPRPEFAATYLMLGEQYQKAGQTDNARQTWVRGATLFPNSPSLQAKLAAGP